MSMELCDLAAEYFETKMKKIYLLNRHTGEVTGFYGRHLNPKGRDCYFLTVLALMGLKKEDKRYCGMIDTTPLPHRQSIKDYKHSWVEYRFDEEVFVYDPLFSSAIPQSVYYEMCKPRKVTSNRTQVEVLKPYLNNRYAYRLGNADWQFKKIDEKTVDKNLEESTKYIFSALQRGRLMGYFDDSDCEILSFIAYDPRTFEKEV